MLLWLSFHNFEWLSLSRPRLLSWMHRPTGGQEVAGSTPAEVGNILVEIDHEIFCTVILSLPWFKKDSWTILVNRLED